MTGVACVVRLTCIAAVTRVLGRVRREHRSRVEVIDDRQWQGIDRR
jgi:hypothetical protein